MPARSTNSPYISLVVTARNDDHGGNMIGRMQAFLDAWLGQARRYDLPSEIIVVEWNPPRDRARLIEALGWPQQPHPCTVRFIEVPEAVHQRFANADKIPLHQMIGKNVGIRRAEGEFVLATNLDIIFSAELMRFLAERGLERGVLYRIDRHDIASAVPSHATADELLAFCEKHILRVFSAEGEFELEPGGTRRLEPCDIVAPGGGIHFGAGWYRVEVYESAPFRWIADEAEIIFRRRHKRETGLFLDVDVGPSAKDGVLSLEIVDSRQSVLATAAVERRSKLRLHIPEHISFASIRLRPICERVPIGADPRFLCLRVYGLRILHAGGGPFFGPQDADDEQESTVKAGLEHRELAVTQTSSNKGWFLEVLETLPSSDWSAMHQHVSPFAKDMLHPAYLHTNGSGDFTLLARQHWWDLRGYAQLPIWPMHVDSILCYSAHHAGIRQKVLREPMRIFHIEHRSGAGWTPEGERERAARIEAKGVGVISNDDLVKWIDQMRRLNAPVILNREDWGLADLDLQERVAPCS